MSARGTYASSAVFALLSFGSIAALSLVSSVVTARLYGVEDVGAFALAMAPVGVCSALSTLQEQAALGRELAGLEPREPRVTGVFVAVQIFSTGLTVVAGAATLAVSAVVFSGPIDRPDLIPVTAALLAAYVVLDNTAWNLDVVLAVFHAGRQLFWARLAYSIGFLIAVVVFAVTIEGVWGLALGQIAGGALSLVVRLATIRRFMAVRVPMTVVRDGLRLLPSLLRFGAKLAPSFVFEAIAHETGTWIAGLTTSVRGVGAWSRAWFLVRRLMEPGWRIGEVLLPALVRHRAAGDLRAFDRDLVDSVRYVLAGMLVLSAAGAGAAEGIMAVFGPGFEAGADPLAVLLLTPPMYVVVMLQGQALLALDRPLTVAKLTTMRAVVMIGAGIGLSVPFGLVGLAVGWALGYALDCIVRTVVLRRRLSTPVTELWPPRAMAALVVACAVAYAASRLVDAHLGPGGVVLALAAGGACYLAAFLLCGGVLDRDRERLTRLRRRRGREADPGTATTLE